MKNSLLILSILTFAFFSCETESIDVQNDENAIVNIETQTTRSPGLGGPTPDYSSHELSLEWAAFAAATVMRKDNTIRQDVIDEVDVNTKSISAEDLLGTNPLIPDFKSDFEFYFQLFVSCSDTPLQGNDCPDGDDSPNGNACPPCNGFGPGGEAQIMIDYLIEHCTEFYFPRGNNTSDSDDIMALGHPMNTDINNEGFIVTTSTSQSQHVPFVHPNYVQLNEMTYIVARPERVPGVIECTYSDISEVDFTFFLSGAWTFVP
ncbi:MAG: hypothetical protein AAF466_12530 [Bacteroidota bacterium]